jgi:hypothetical protein
MLAVSLHARASLLLGLAISLVMCAQSLAQQQYNDEHAPEGWAWPHIKSGTPANFNERCGGRALDPRAAEGASWMDRCRRLSAKFLIDVATHEPLRGQIPFSGVLVIGARIDGDIVFTNAILNRSFVVMQSRIENNILGLCT